MIGNVLLLGATFLVGYALGYEDKLLGGKARPKDRLDELSRIADEKRKAYLDSLNIQQSTE